MRGWYWHRQRSQNLDKRLRPLKASGWMNWIELCAKSNSISWELKAKQPRWMRRSCLRHRILTAETLGERRSTQPRSERAFDSKSLGQARRENETVECRQQKVETSRFEKNTRQQKSILGLIGISRWCKLPLAQWCNTYSNRGSMIGMKLAWAVDCMMGLWREKIKKLMERWKSDGERARWIHKCDIQRRGMRSDRKSMQQTVGGIDVYTRVKLHNQLNVVQLKNCSLTVEKETACGADRKDIDCSRLNYRHNFLEIILTSKSIRVSVSDSIVTQVPGG